MTTVEIKFAALGWKLTSALRFQSGEPHTRQTVYLYLYKYYYFIFMRSEKVFAVHIRFLHNVSTNTLYIAYVLHKIFHLLLHMVHIGSFEEARTDIRHGIMR